MKTSRYTFAVITALFSIAGFTSCNNDDDFASSYDDTMIEMASNSTNDTVSCPENLPENHHIGATITKKVRNYGDNVVFTCISNKAPYYFVHTSEREYSAKEMNEMDYQHNSMAVDKDTLNAIAMATCDYGRSFLEKTVHNSFWNKTEWNVDDNGFAEGMCNVFGTGNAISEGTTIVSVTSKLFWIRNSDHGYPYAKFYSEMSLNSYDRSWVNDFHEHCYMTANKSYSIMFCVIGR